MLGTLDRSRASRKVGAWTIEPAADEWVVIHPYLGSLARFAERRDAMAFAYRSQSDERVNQFTMS